MVHTKVTGGKNFGATGAAILRADLPVGMSKREFLELSRRVKRGEGAPEDQAVIAKVLGNSLLRRDGGTSAADGFDLRKKTNKKHLSAQKKRMKAKRKQDQADIESRIKASLENRANSFIKKMESAKTVGELERKFEASTDRFSGRSPNLSSRVNKQIDGREKTQDAYYNPKTGRLWSQSEISSSSRIRSAIRRQNAQDSAARRRAENFNRAYEKFIDRYSAKVFKAYEKLENNLPVGD